MTDALWLTSQQVVPHQRTQGRVVRQRSLVFSYENVYSKYADQNVSVVFLTVVVACFYTNVYIPIWTQTRQITTTCALRNRHSNGKQTWKSSILYYRVVSSNISDHIRANGSVVRFPCELFTGEAFVTDGCQFHRSISARKSRQVPKQ